MAEAEQQDMISGLLSEFNTRLRDIEEKQRLLKERVLLIGNNLVKGKEDVISDIDKLENNLNKINNEIERLKSNMQRIFDEIPGLARKSELAILERQLKMFQPLKFATSSELQQLKIQIERLQK